MSADVTAWLDELDQAREKATPGPWTYDPSEGDTVWDADEHRPSIIALTRDPYGHCEADAALIVAAVNALPKLTAALRDVLDLAHASDDGSEYEHTHRHGPGEGEPECPACWAEDIRDAIAGAVR